MIAKVVFALTLFSLVVCEWPPKPKKWALLVAGSEGYVNYRHQASVCHAYHILRDHGVPASNIVTMMADDIANHPLNPVPGTLINEPGGEDVYGGVTIDYSGSELSPDLFYKVLKGDKKGVFNKLQRNGKVIESDISDQVFLYYTDHGGVGMLAMHDGSILAKDFGKALVYMELNMRYAEMLIYVEACYSGSMFNDRRVLPTSTKVYAMTSANPSESSYACDYDEKTDAWLGSVFSSNWMKDSDTQDLKTRTVKQQFDWVKKETESSHVSEYGDKQIKQIEVGEFQGNVTWWGLTKRGATSSNTDVIRADLVEMDILQKRIAAAASGEQANGLRNELDALIQKNSNTNTFFRNMVKHSTDTITYEALMDTPVNVQDYDCHHAATKLIYSVCPGMTLAKNYEALKNLKVLANLCETGVPQERIMAAITKSAHTNVLC